MKSILILLAALLSAAPAAANPLMMWAAMGGDGQIPFTVQGSSSFSGGSFVGTQYGVATGDGFITAKASCSADAVSSATVYLYVDGSAVTLACSANQTKTDQVLSRAVSAGEHTVTVSTGVSGSGYTTAINTFRKPAGIAQTITNNFDNNTLQGWTATEYILSAAQPLSGAYSIYDGPSSSGVLTKTISSAGGDYKLWIKATGSLSGSTCTMSIDGGSSENCMPSQLDTWSERTLAVPTDYQTLRVQTTAGPSTIFYIDDISYPVSR